MLKNVKGKMKMKYLYLLSFCLGFVIVFGSLTAKTDLNDPLVKAIMFMIESESFHPKKGDVEFAEAMANAVKRAGEKYSVDPWLLAAMAHFESKYRPDIISGKVKGKAGEIGILQCGPDCARSCDHFMNDALGQAFCGARWLKYGFDQCKDSISKKSDEWKALVMYASGHYCNPPEGTPFKWKANKRIRLRDRLKNKFLGGEQ